MPLVMMASPPAPSPAPSSSGWRASRSPDLSPSSIRSHNELEAGSSTFRQSISHPEKATSELTGNLEGEISSSVMGSPQQDRMESTMEKSSDDALEGQESDISKPSSSRNGFHDLDTRINHSGSNGVQDPSPTPEDGEDSDAGSTFWSEIPNGGTRDVDDISASRYQDFVNGLLDGRAGRKRGRSSLSDHGLGIVLEHAERTRSPNAHIANGYSPVDVSDGSDIANVLRNFEENSANESHDKDKVLKLSPASIQELTSSPQSIPYRAVPSGSSQRRRVMSENTYAPPELDLGNASTRSPREAKIPHDIFTNHKPSKAVRLEDSDQKSTSSVRRPRAPRTLSSPTARRPASSSANDRILQAWLSRSKQSRQSNRADSETKRHLSPSPQLPESSVPSPLPPSIPAPPLSIPTYLQLELASGRPSPLYIHRSATTDFPYESSRVKLERLTNFLILPPALEQVLWFGILACLDSWLYSFTILPLRFFKAVYVLLASWAVNLGVEFRFISSFTFKGVGRVWRRRTGSSAEPPEELAGSNTQQDASSMERERSKTERKRHRSDTNRPLHRRRKSIPSALMPDDKADILKGLLMIATCCILMFFDASRMYHWIRGQAAIKLYVIYNVLEVSDRLFAAIGQDVLECLFSREALERKPDGRSKVSRPFWLFLLALAYTVIHATALFYQVMTLNVAVNSYSNALITLLLSNQFVEIKSTVFKKFEKENLFQLTCADVVERFQLWLMLTIIASRNIVETGAFNVFGTLSSSVGGDSSTSTNSTPLSTPPRSSTSILPQAFTIFPSSVIASFSNVNTFLPAMVQVLGPFLVVLGSEMIVDWLKHAYINKFNNTRPTIYGRFLDILAKDYYNHAFGDQNLTRRLGLPVIPLSCLFFRVSVQTYKMFLAALLPQHPSSTAVEATSLSSIQSQYVPSPHPSTQPLTLKTFLPTTAAHMSSFFRTLLANAMPSPQQSVYIFTAVFLLTGFILLLTLKLLLGMLLLTLARSRYRLMKSHESEPPVANGVGVADNHHDQSQHQHQHHADKRGRNYTVDGSRRVGGWGVVEVTDDKQRWIYADDPDGLKRMKGKEEKERSGPVVGGKGEELSMEHVSRYEMVAKRIW